MIRHVVMFKYQEEAEGNDKKYNLNKTKELLEKLQDKVEEIKYIFI
ncbi:Dabb family protein [Vallitalea guaymasensis]|nr:Dabb family protein [Vallitalea guaymasensis]